MSAKPKVWPSPDVATRISLFGAPLSGRSEILQQTVKDLLLPAPESCVGVEVPARILLLRGQDFAAAAVVGSLYAPHEWRRVLQWSNRVLVVLDPQRPREEGIRHFLREFEPDLSLPRIRAAQVTKIDLARGTEGLQRCFPPAEVPSIFGLSNLPTFLSTNTEPSTLSAGLRYLIDAS